MKKIVTSLLFLGIAYILSAQACKDKYVIADSIAETKENQIGLKYLASYYPILDSINQLKFTAFKKILPLRQQIDSLKKEREAIDLAIDSVTKSLNAGQKVSEKFQKRIFAQYEESEKKLKDVEKRLDDFTADVLDWKDVYDGLSSLSRIRVRHLVGPLYEKVLSEMCVDGKFIVKGKEVFSAEFLPVQ